MAWLEQQESGIYHICFRIGEERIKRSARTRDERKAEATLARIEENLELVQRGRLQVPEEGDLFTFLLSDGKLNSPKPAIPKQIKLSELFAAYNASLPNDALAQETLRVAAIHAGHLVRILGATKKLRSIQRDDLQHYVNRRSDETGKRGRHVSAGTIKKEIATFRTLWRWAHQSALVGKEFPNHGLHYPLQRQAMPFHTWNQIQQQLARGIPAGQTEDDYWDCLYLNRAELDELLADIQQQTTYGFLFPMAYMAAHTGARRSEVCRSLRQDIDFENDCILIRERKRQKGRETFRHVPMSPGLKAVLADWLGKTALSHYTFPADHRVTRFRNSNRRENDESVAVDEATDHLSWALQATKWSKIRGWHMFRHSFISNLASHGVDQRMIDAWVGHQTEEMRLRYRHLFPNRQKKELDRVFG